MHCSDGWDRTAQLSSLAQICLDPHARTIRGLAILIEKEWVGFGHKFRDRCGHLHKETATPGGTGGGLSHLQLAKSFFGSKGVFFGSDSSNQSVDYLASSEQGTSTPPSGSTTSASGPKRVKPREVSPVFPQFLDCVYQLWTQFPTRFEYSPALLDFLLEHVFSCRYTNFIFNNEKERFENAHLNGADIWDAVQSDIARFVNPSYVPTENLQDCGGGTGRISTTGEPGTISLSSSDSVVLFPRTDRLVYWPVYMCDSRTATGTSMSQGVDDAEDLSNTGSGTSNGDPDGPGNFEPEVSLPPRIPPRHVPSFPSQQVREGAVLEMLDMSQVNIDRPNTNQADINAQLPVMHNSNYVQNPFAAIQNDHASLQRQAGKNSQASAIEIPHSEQKQTFPTQMNMEDKTILHSTLDIKDSHPGVMEMHELSLDG